MFHGVNESYTFTSLIHLRFFVLCTTHGIELGVCLLLDYLLIIKRQQIHELHALMSFGIPFKSISLLSFEVLARNELSVNPASKINKMALL